MKSQYVIRQSDIAGYSPANHTGTFNQRLIGKETVGARKMEVLIGTITKTHGALAHAHPSLDQAGYILEGEGLVESDQGHRVLRTGDWALFPLGMPHRFTVLSDVLRTVVVYAPPYQENADASIPCDGAVTESKFNRLPPVVPAEQTIEPHGYLLTALRPVISPARGGTRYLEAFEVAMRAGGGKEDGDASDTEQVLHLLHGEVRGSINREAFSAGSGDWIFIPAAARWTIYADSDVAALLLRAADFTTPAADALDSVPV